MIIGGSITREEMAENAQAFIKQMDAMRMPRLGVAVVFWDRGDKAPVMATNVSQREFSEITRKLHDAVSGSIVVPGNGSLA